MYHRDVVQRGVYSFPWLGMCIVATVYGDSVRGEREVMRICFRFLVPHFPPPHTHTHARTHTHTHSYTHTHTHTHTRTCAHNTHSSWHALAALHYGKRPSWRVGKFPRKTYMGDYCLVELRVTHTLGGSRYFWEVLQTLKVAHLQSMLCM